MLWSQKVNHAMIRKSCPSHKPMSTHLKNDLLYIFAFLKAWTMAYRWNRSEKYHIFFDKVSTSTPHETDTLEVWADQLPWPRSFYDAGMVLPDKGPNAWFICHVALTLWIGFKHQLQFVFFANTSDFGFYVLLLLFCFSRRAWMFFKGYGCSKTERIQKWLGALSNALLKVHYKDE